MRPPLAQRVGARGAVLRLRSGIRKMIYTTNAVEALYRSLRKIVKTRGSFPTDEAALVEGLLLILGSVPLVLSSTA
jgi:transposase-like protein